ncbi:MAG: sensor histidine kinase [Verrucomicrobiales bacterium]|nr:sensor histidine kinase [Verrucomicrobiales bacterium]
MLDRARLQEEFSRGLIEAQESERARLAGELHDDLGQDLLVMKSRIDLARRRSSSEAEQDMLLQLSESAAEVLQKTRALSHQLRPLHLDHLGLGVCVSSLVKEVAEASQLEFEVEADDVQGGLSPEGEVALFRMLQESLNNIVKHAAASSVKVELRHHERSVTLTVQDDGRGLPPETPTPGAKHPGHGLHAMKERCALVGGTMTVKSTRGMGTLVLIEVPLSTPRKA